MFSLVHVELFDVYVMIFPFPGDLYQLSSHPIPALMYLNGSLPPLAYSGECFPFVCLVRASLASPRPAFSWSFLAVVLCHRPKSRAEVWPFPPEVSHKPIDDLFLYVQRHQFPHCMLLCIVLVYLLIGA